MSTSDLYRRAREAYINKHFEIQAKETPKVILQEETPKVIRRIEKAVEQHLVDGHVYVPVSEDVWSVVFEEVKAHFERAGFKCWGWNPATGKVHVEWARPGPRPVIPSPPCSSRNT